MQLHTLLDENRIKLRKRSHQNNNKTLVPCFNPIKAYRQSVHQTVSHHSIL